MTLRIRERDDSLFLEKKTNKPVWCDVEFVRLDWVTPVRL